MLEFIGLNKDTLTAGPGARLELFTKGCARGVVNPCEGCFNPETWSFSGPRKSMSPEETATFVKEHSWNGLVTFCGGEPILQGKNLLKVMKDLKNGEDGDRYHFLLYMSYKADKLLEQGLSFIWKEEYGLPMKYSLAKYSESFERLTRCRVKFNIISRETVREIFSLTDIIIDGTYVHSKRLTQSETMHEGWFVGSSNQKVIYGPETIQQGEVVFDTAEEYNKILEENGACLSCMKPTKEKYCSNECKNKHDLFKQLII